MLCLILTLLLKNSAFSQTVGLFQHSAGSNDNGYVLFSPMSYSKTYLIDKCGKQVHSWSSTYNPGLSASLMTDGILLRTGNTVNNNFNAGGRGGILQKINWSNNVVWSYTISNALMCQHHDALPLDNGNILTIVWEKKTSAEAIAAGRNPATAGTELWSEKIMELRPTGTNTADIVWEWKVWDNLIQDFDSSKPNFGVVADHPELINLNYTGSGPSSEADWLHINSVDYNPEFNQIMLSVHDFSEIWIIDRDFGASGKIVYRWGNPLVYNRGTSMNQKLFVQHNAQWIKSGLNRAGDILIFNNGGGRPGGNYSSLDIIKPPVDANGNYTINSGMSFSPDSAYWSYKDSVPSNFYATNISGVQALNNGNFLYCSGPTGNFLEIDSLKRRVWKYVNPVNASGPITQGNTPNMNSVFRCSFYNSNFSGFNGQVLIPGNPIELNPLNYTCSLITEIQNLNETLDFRLYQNYPNPFNPETAIKYELKVTDFVSINVYDILGNKISELINEKQNPGSYSVKFNGNDFSSGVYYYTLTSGDVKQTKKMLLIK